MLGGGDYLESLSRVQVYIVKIFDVDEMLYIG
jgi:hypothetical protein